MVTGNGNTIASGTGRALWVSDTDIGAGGLVFARVDSSGGVGGILVATVLTILVLPAGYALFFGREPKKAKTDEQAPAPEQIEGIERPQLALAAE